MVSQKYKEVASRYVIHPCYKIEVLDYADHPIKEITQEVSKDNPGSISANYQQGVRRTSSFTISDPAKLLSPARCPELFGFDTKFKIYVGLKDVDTYDIYWFSQGIYYTVDPLHDGRSITLSGVDKFGIWGTDTGYNQLDGTYRVPEGTNAYQAIRDILRMDMGNGHPIDCMEPIFDPKYSDFTLPYDIEKNPGGSMADILIEIANVLGCDIYYDTEGRLNVQNGTLDLSYSQQSSIWEFSSVLPEYFDSTISLNTKEAVNIVKIIGNNDRDRIYESVAENHNPLSPTAIEKIGKKIYYEENSNIYNQERCDDYAAYTLRNKSIIQSSVQFQSSLLPHLDVNRVIGITDRNFRYENQRFILQTITVPLTSQSPMDCGAALISSLPYYDLRNGGVT